jgi:hydrogenase nickel incorporation protein HypA/HybF
MHEASIVHELIALAGRSCPPGGLVMALDVRVGLLTGVSPDAMAFYFEALREDTLGSQAQLRVRLEPLRANCADCGNSCTMMELDWTCPFCGVTLLRFENGDELDLVSLEVDDGGADHDRAEDPEEEPGRGGGQPG